MHIAKFNRRDMITETDQKQRVIQRQPEALRHKELIGQNTTLGF